MSKIAKILIKKQFSLPKKNIHKNLVDIIDTFHTELRVGVKDSNGFIKADSYWKQNENTIITLVEWDNIKTWEEWKNSEKRKNIVDKYQDSFILNEEVDILKKYKYYDVFLL